MEVDEASNDSDVFVICQYKPLAVKRDFFDKLINDKDSITQQISSTHVKKETVDLEIIEEVETFDKKPSIPIYNLSPQCSKMLPAQKRKATPEKKHSPFKKVTDYFSPSKTTSDSKRLHSDASTSSKKSGFVEAGLNCTKDYSEAVIKKELSFSSVDISKGKNATFNQTGRNSSEKIITAQAEESIIDSDVQPGDATRATRMFRSIMHEVCEKQLQLKAEAENNKKDFENLFTNSELEIFEKFLSMNEAAQNLYVRLFGRMKAWFRYDALESNYPDISNDIVATAHMLQENKLIRVNIDDEPLHVQLDMLKSNDIKVFCTLFSVPLNKVNLKKDMIKALIQEVENQRSVTDFFKQNANQGLRLRMLKTEVKKKLGNCMKLNETVLKMFERVILLYSFVLDISEEPKRWSEVSFMSMSNYVPYNLSQTVIFHTREDFLLYEEALWRRHEFWEASNSLSGKKDGDYFKIYSEHSEAAEIKLNELVANKEYCERILKLETFLRRYSAGSVYASMLTKYCQTHKTKTSRQKICEILKQLLDQKVFSVSKRGKWYELLSATYESLSEFSLAATTLLTAQEDKYLNDIQKLTLQLRGAVLLKKKLKEVELRKAVDDFSTITVQEAPIILISGKCLSGNKSGNKSVYIKETENECLLLSVEEYSITHYKSTGFTEGVHAEGSIIQYLYFILFFDIIYGMSPPGVFQCPLQLEPLDFGTKLFYCNRKTEIDKRLSQISSFTDIELKEEFERIFKEQHNFKSIVSWKDSYTPDMCCELITCLGRNNLVKIFERFVHNYRVYRSGFPDLTLWNYEEKRCKFVEVKGPNDKLAPNQRVWLDFLRKIGVDCEVCNVKNTAWKSN